MESMAPRVGAPRETVHRAVRECCWLLAPVVPDASYLLLLDSGGDVTRRLRAVTGVEGVVGAGVARGR